LDRPIIITETHLTGAGFYSRPTPAILIRVFLVFHQYLPRKGCTITSYYHTPLPSTSLRNHHPTNILPETVTTFLNTLSVAPYTSGSLQKLSKSLEPTSKFWAPGRWHEASSTEKPLPPGVNPIAVDKIYHISGPGDLAPGICTALT